MNIYLKHIEDLGFKGVSILNSKFSWHYYLSIPKKNRVVGVTNHTPQMIYYFDLTPKQYKDFKNGKLSLIPPGCCNPSGGKELENAVIGYQNNIKNKKELIELLKKFI